MQSQTMKHKIMKTNDQKVSRQDSHRFELGFLGLLSMTLSITPRKAGMIKKYRD